jgi:hypothetical protein
VRLACHRWLLEVMLEQFDVQVKHRNKHEQLNDDEIMNVALMSIYYLKKIQNKIQKKIFYCKIFFKCIHFNHGK